MDIVLEKIQNDLDSIKKISATGLEYWSARELMTVLGYSTWAKFREALNRAKESVDSSKENITNHFADAGKMVLTGSGASRNIEDILLTRYACSIVALNGDPRKPEIALVQAYFATQTRKQEILEQREKENKRLEARNKLRDTEKKIQSTVYERGIKLPVEFGIFKNEHIKALYGGISTLELKKKRNIPESRALADFDTHVELSAKNFALAITDHNIKEKNLKGQYQMTEEVVKNSKATRQTLLSRNKTRRTSKRD